VPIAVDSALEEPFPFAVAGLYIENLREEETAIQKKLKTGMKTWMN